ncbi:MAG: ATP phosphoribosyltransferase [Candidatus Micrarchaeota archaeon]
MLTIAIPNKGRVQQPVLQMLEQIGIKVDVNGGRGLLIPSSKRNVRALLARSMDIPLMVERRAADIGFTGEDAVAERGSRVECVLPLDFGRCKVVLAAPRPVSVPKSIATTLPNVTKAFCRREGLRADIITLQGALESAPKLGIAEAIVDQMETGTTLKENRLRVLEVIMESRMTIIANGISLAEKKGQIDEIALSAGGLMAARQRVVLKVNAGSERVRDALLKLIPAMKSPDVAPLAEPGAYSLLAAVPRKGLERLIVRIKAAGGTDILVEKPQFIIP